MNATLLNPTELRALACQCEERGGYYVEIVGQDAGITVTAKLDDESGGEEFTIRSDDGRVIRS